MLGTARLDVQFEFDLTDQQAATVAGVQHLDDVRAAFGDERRHARELAGPIGQRDAQLEVALRGRQPVADHPLHDHGIDVAAAQDDDGRAARAHLSGKDRRHSHGTGRLDDELRAFQQHQQRLRHVVLADGDDLVDDPTHDLEVELAGLRHGDAVGDRRQDRDLGRGTLLE